MSELGSWLQENRLLLGAAVAVLIGLIVLSRVFGGFRRILRRRRPAKLHPKLQPYAGRTEADVESDRQAAAGIIATSSTGAVAGYETVRQIEAVFVEGHRTQDECITALKATAARRGANAITNVSQQRTAAGRCTAQGDAVQIRPTGK